MAGLDQQCSSRNYDPVACQNAENSFIENTNCVEILDSDNPSNSCGGTCGNLMPNIEEQCGDIIGFVTI